MAQIKQIFTDFKFLQLNDGIILKIICGNP